MKTRFRHLRDDERGMSFVFVGMGFMAFMAATVLAVDVGMLMTARNQAQTSADAGALSGANALAFKDFSDHSATGPAVTGAISAAQTNLVMGQAPSVTPTDVTFPFDATTSAFDQVQVNVYRTAARTNPLATLIAGMFGSPTADVQATATAVAMPANEMSCVLPFTIPDKWIEHVDSNGNPDGPWNPSDTFDIAAAQGQQLNAGAPFANPDVYRAPGTTDPTGYIPLPPSKGGDLGTYLTLKPNSQNTVTPSFYNPWDIGGATGANEYSNNIGGCNPTYTEPGQNMVPETGNMVGPTNDGVQALINSDPGAYWDTGCNCVKGSAFPTSPRLRAIPLYDPYIYAQDQHAGKSQSTLTIVNYIGFFISDYSGGQVTGYIAPIVGDFKKGGPILNGSFARAIMLVQ
jgi:putative Flp pilus-assembly TadE/G-like protein